MPHWWIYYDHYLGQPVRVAVLLQPVAGAGGRGMATIQVAETLELRRTLAPWRGRCCSTRCGGRPRCWP